MSEKKGEFSIQRNRKAIISVMVQRTWIEGGPDMSASARTYREPHCISEN
jgi:hypothetical protein